MFQDVRNYMIHLPPLVADTALAAAVIVATFLHFFAWSGSNAAELPLGGWSYLFALVTLAPLAVRRSWPLFTLAVILIGNVVYVSAGFADGPYFLGIVIALYSVAVQFDRRMTVIVGTLIIVPHLVAITGFKLFSDTGDPTFEGYDGVLAMIIALAVGDAVRSRQEYVTEILKRAEDAERTRDLEASRRVAEERLRIASELHDAVAHSIAMINVQAGSAAHVIDTQPEKARESLVNIKTVSRSVLRELRAMVGVLRDDELEPSRDPTPGLERLEPLIESTRTSGVAVDVEINGEKREVSTPVSLAAYRIVQESLTNAVRHAQPDHITVELIYLPDALEARIRNDGVRPGVTLYGETGGAGLGIIGMRERAMTLGGSLEAGPVADGRYQVTARLPYEPAMAARPG